MKKLIVLLVLLCAVTVSAEPAEIKCTNIFTGTIAASGVDTEYPPLEIQRKSGFEGFFSVQVVKSGTGVLKIEYQLSNDGKTWSPAVQIVAAAVSGTIYPYPATGVNIFAGYQRLVLTETGTANEVFVTGVYRCVQ